jgi:Flp pilus assembly protein TadG
MMFNTHSVQNKLRSLLADRQGNFAMMTAIMLPVLFGFAGAGLEVTRALQVKADLQSTADAATLAGATAARLAEGKKSDAQIAAETNIFMMSQPWAQQLTDAEKKDVNAGLKTVATSAVSPLGTDFTVTTNLNYNIKLNPLLGFVGVSTMKVSVTSTAKSSFNKGAAISMYLVLDRSGSMSFKTNTVDKSKYSCPNYTMDNWGWYPYLNSSSPCYVNKSASLKSAVSYLVDTLNKADPTYSASATPASTLVRTAAIGYDSKTYDPQKMGWGTKAVNTYVQAIPQYPSGGTDARTGLKTAYDALKKSNTDEATEHTSKKNSSFERFIVLMTDGEMTGDSSLWDSSIDASVRTTCATAKADGIKIFTVAFMAPDKGKSLLQACATSQDNYYAPENVDEIVEAFGDIARKAAGNISRLTN